MSKKTELLDDIGKMPDFLVALRPHTVWEKTPVKLFCTVQGNPRPIVKWSEYTDDFTLNGRYNWPEINGEICVVLLVFFGMCH